VICEEGVPLLVGALEWSACGNLLLVVCSGCMKIMLRRFGGRNRSALSHGRERLPDSHAGRRGTVFANPGVTARALQIVSIVPEILSRRTSTKYWPPRTFRYVIFLCCQSRRTCVSVRSGHIDR
jgi:hypothetical protein